MRGLSGCRCDIYKLRKSILKCVRFTSLDTYKSEDKDLEQ